MKSIALIIMVSIVLEALIEYVKTIYTMIDNKEYKTAITQGISIVIGIGLAFIFNLHLFNDAMSEFYDGLYINPTIDIVLTGILFSRGANYFSDLVSRLTKPSEIVNPDDLIYDPSDATDVLSSTDGMLLEKDGE